MNEIIQAVLVEVIPIRVWSRLISTNVHWELSRAR
jgi:hypothetical protein